MKKSLLTVGLLAAVVLSATACRKKAEEVVEAGSEIAVITSEVVVETSEAVSEVAEAADGDYTEEFASMVDALDSGKYYAFAEIGGVHALLVAESTFDYGEGMTVLSGDVQCGGTAYAICVLDGKLIYGNRAEVNRASIGEDLALVVEEGAQEDYEEATVVSFISK